MVLTHAPGHSRVTESRIQASTGGHARTRASGGLSTEGHAGTGRDARGVGTTTVRDREAPGSNPGPPTNSRMRLTSAGTILPRREPPSAVVTEFIWVPRSNVTSLNSNARVGALVR
jgi:hypothetical protein